MAKSTIDINDNHVEFELAPIGLGTAGLGANTAEIVRAAVLEHGVRLIDTAQAEEWYSEDGVSRGLLAASEGLQIDTPVMIVTKIHPRSFALNKMRERLERSISLLVDPFSRNSTVRTELVVLLHSTRCWPGHCSPEEEAISWRTGWKNLEILKRDLAVRAIGVSNFHEEELQELVLSIANERVSVVQNWMDPFHHDWDLRSFAAEHHIQYMAYSSFGTQWLGRRFSAEHNPVFENPVLEQIAEKHRTDIAQVVLAWLLSSAAVAIPRASRLDHLRTNFRFLATSSSSSSEPLQLDDQDLAEIGELDGILGDPWDEE
eukprot:gene24916-33409_t